MFHAFFTERERELLAMPEATLDDLVRFKPRAELVNRRIVPLKYLELQTGRSIAEITFSLQAYEKQSGRGEAFGSNVAYGFEQPLPSGRQSLSAMTSYYVGKLSSDGYGAIPRAPVFAVEIRSEDADFKAGGDADFDEKRHDYFTAGTHVVWDVDPMSKTVSKYTSRSEVTVFKMGDIADAEPALPGWRLPVDDIFPNAD